MVLLLFFCSGATALIYEVVWSKYLALLFGSTIQAQTVVLAVFMGGLALGNKLFGNFADRVRRPLRVYGAVEIGIGLCALLFPFVYSLADRIFALAGAEVLNQSTRLLLLKGGISIALLLVPTVLMGGTLPVLAAWLQQNTADAGRRSARFYSINSLGAVCGAFLAGFLLVQWLGLRGTVQVAALINILIGLVALAIGRSGKNFAPEIQAADPSVRSVDSTEITPVLFGWSCVLVALTGAVSMGLEVLASRCLCLILGASLQVFATVLMAFILGIGLGSAVVASPRLRQWPRGSVSIVLMLLASGLIGFLVFHIEELAGFYRLTQSGLSRTSTGYHYHQILALLMAMGVLGLPAAALGSVLPLWIRAFGSNKLLGEKVGRLLTWNTLGAVGGVLLTGFVLMPTIGLRNAFTLLAVVLAVAGLITAVFARQYLAGALSAAMVGLLAIVNFRGGDEWRYALSAGVFRLPDAVDGSSDFFKERRKFTQLLFYEDAPDATVSVERETPAGGYTNLTLRIDGKPDASSPGDLSTQILLGQLPLMMKPDARDVFVLGMGSGISAGTTLGYPIERLTVADNCEPVLRAVKFFEPWNQGVHTNSRTRIYREDARTVLKLSPEKYDVIISEPSNPWMAGVGSVFSQEFYQIAARRLKPGGIMSQWFHTYEIDDQILELVVRTFASVFPAVEIWDVAEGDVVLLGSDRPWKSDPEVYARAFALPAAQRDLASIGLSSPTAVLARQFASQRTAFALAGPGRIQSDNDPILEYEAPRTFYMYLAKGAKNFQRYDERTWQMDLASPAKNQQLAAFDLANINAIFGGVALSVNHDLQALVRHRVQGGDGNLVFGSRVMPCVFKDKSAGDMVFAPASTQTNLISRQLYFGEIMLRSDVAKQVEAIQSIKTALAGLQDYRAQDFDWSAAHYADLAVKASLRLGMNGQAKDILLLGLRCEPDSEELQYLARILIREGVLQASEIPQAVSSKN